MTKSQKFRGVVTGYNIPLDVATSVFGYDFKSLEIRDIYCLNGVNQGTFRVGVKWTEDGNLRHKEIISTDKGMYNELLHADEAIQQTIYSQILEAVIGAETYAKCKDCGKIMVSKRCGWCGCYRSDRKYK